MSIHEVKPATMEEEHERHGPHGKLVIRRRHRSLSIKPSGVIRLPGYQRSGMSQVPDQAAEHPAGRLAAKGCA